MHRLRFLWIPLVVVLVASIVPWLSLPAGDEAGSTFTLGRFLAGTLFAVPLLFGLAVALSVGGVGGVRAALGYLFGGGVDPVLAGRTLRGAARGTSWGTLVFSLCAFAAWVALLSHSITGGEQFDLGWYRDAVLLAPITGLVIGRLALQPLAERALLAGGELSPGAGRTDDLVALLLLLTPVCTLSLSFLRANWL